MAIKVVDASSLIAIMFDEPEAGAIALDLEGATLVAPLARQLNTEFVTLARRLARAAALPRPESSPITRGS